jgi:hypothetical protein
LSDYPRRRRLEPEPPKRGGIPIIPLMVLVILGGLLLGGLLTKIFGAGGTVQAPTARPSFTPLPESTATFAATPSPTPSRSASPSASASASASASPSAKPSPSVKPSPSAKVLATVHPTTRATPTIVILTPTPSATRVAARAAVATQPPTAPPTLAPTAVSLVTPTPVLITGANSGEHAAAIVRAYISALAHGDSATAAGYLASGLPTESFINPEVGVNVADLRTNRNDNGSYAVTAQIVTSKGTYIASFTLRMGTYGMQITEHSATHI